MGPKFFWTDQIILVKYQSFWTVPNSPEKSNLNLAKMIWTRPKRFWPNQNNFHPSKTICTVQNNFEPIEGQGINELAQNLLHNEIRLN